MREQFLAGTTLGLQAIGSELILAVTILGVVIADLFLKREKSYRVVWVAFVGTVMALVYALIQWNLQANDTTLHFHGTVTTDNFAVLFKLLILTGTAITLLLSRFSGELWRVRSGEYYALLLTTATAANLLVSSTNLLMLFLALETLSLPAADALAFGDNYNDLEMLACVGMGVAMGNAPAAVKAASAAVTAGNDGEGIAAFLKKLFPAMEPFR